MSSGELFADLYRRHYRHVFAYCRRRTSSDEAEVATAETFLVAWRRLDRVPRQEKERAWLYGVAQRVLSQQWRSRGRQRRLNERLASLGVTVVAPPDSQFLDGAEKSQVMRAASKLRPRELEILHLALWEEMSTEDIAVILDISIEAVRQRLSRARRNLTRSYNALEARYSEPTHARKGGAS